MRRARGWTCQHTTHGVKCGHHNPPRTRRCVQCLKPRPARRREKHMAALEIPYEEYVRINGGEFCGVCGRTTPTGRNRHFDRDHDHDTGLPRGLLCRPCNRCLVASRFGMKITLAWLQSAVAYLQRHEARIHARP